MKFKLNDYHRNISNEELIDDLKSVAAKFNKTSISTNEYNKEGLYHVTTFQKRFGSWITCLELAGLKVEKEQINNVLIDDNDLIQDLKNVASEIGKESVTTGEYKNIGKYDVTTILSHFKTWSKALELSGLKQTGFDKKITNEDLFLDIENTWILLGRQPTTTDLKKNVSKYSLNTFTRRFGSWRKALEAFIQYIDENDGTIINNSDNYEEDMNKVPSDEKKKNRHKRSRDVNLRLRFIVMRRDRFKCCICGASPSNDNVTLHIDHIIPWDKGGETVEINLQTLCSRCNLGKSDLDLNL